MPSAPFRTLENIDVLHYPVMKREMKNYKGTRKKIKEGQKDRVLSCQIENVESHEESQSL